MVRYRCLLAGLLCAGSVHASAAEVVTYVYTDVRGSVITTSDMQGNVLSRSAFTAYGNRVGGLAGSGPGFVGGREDSTGLDYIDGRFYDPAVGIYLSPPSDWRPAEARYVGYGFALGNPYAYGAPKRSP